MRLRRHLTLVPGPPMHLRGGEREILLFEGTPEPWLPDLLRALDGRERGRVTEALPTIPPAELERAIARLREAGVLEEAPAPRPTGTAALVGESPLWAALRPLLIPSGQGEPALEVVHEEVMRPSLLAEFNCARLRDRRPWLLVSLQGGWARIGPLFAPGETCCHECYRARLLSHRAHPEAHRAWEALDQPVGHHAAPEHVAAVAGLVAAEVRRFLERREPLLAGRVLEFDLDRLEGSIEPVWITPYCPACRAPSPC